MANTFKTPPPQQTNSRQGVGGGSLFSAIDNMLKIDQLFEKGLPMKYMPKTLFLTALAIVYIANSHYAERTIRKIDKLKIEVEDLRADYTTQKSDYMYQSKQSEVAKKSMAMNIYESEEPPVKIKTTD